MVFSSMLEMSLKTLSKLDIPFARYYLHLFCSLESLLAVEDADAFVMISKLGQRGILKEILVGRDDLIERVLTSVEQVSVHEFINMDI